MRKRDASLVPIVLLIWIGVATYASIAEKNPVYIILILAFIGSLYLPFAVIAIWNKIKGKKPN